MNRETLRRLTHSQRKPGDLNRSSTHKMKSKMGMGSKVHIREAINKKLGIGKEEGGYLCNCGQIFQTPEERTAHLSSCPRKEDKNAVNKTTSTEVS